MKFEASELEPAFRPFVGDTYRARLDYSLEREPASPPPPALIDRVHVLGESFYSDPGDPDRYVAHDGLTDEVVQDWAYEVSMGGRFFTRIMQATEGVPSNELDRRAAMARIAYSNYIQEILPASRIPPTPAQWTAASRAFTAQLAMTRPVILLVLGRRLWQNMPDHFGEKLPYDLPATSVSGALAATDTWTYPYRDGDGLPHFALATWIFHPSSSKYDRVAAHRRLSALRYFQSNILSDLQKAAMSGVSGEP